MDNFNPLSLLTSLLEASHSAPMTLREGTDIDQVLAEQIASAKSGSRSFEPKDLQIEAVQRFWASGSLESLRDARLVSFGLTVRPWGDSRCVIEDRKLFGAALDGVSAWRDSPRQFRKCYQGLARSYFDYDTARGAVPTAGRENWVTLRDYLRQNVSNIKVQSINPDWVDSALENQGLFTTTPCEAYGKEVLEGNTERVDRVRHLLGISDGSWFTRELIMAQLIQAARREDHIFPQLVSRLLGLIAHNDVLRDPGMQLILDKYSSIPQAPQHVGLKEQAVEWWGNPWLPSNQDRWGGVSQAARDMVSNWLKGEFIELFFTKLAQDGLSDTRRVRFWEKYIPSIGTMQFALGNHAMYSKEKDFVELREKLKGLLVGLDDVNASNNAFIMRIGDLLAVEFSGASNAFYGYSVTRTLPFDLSKPVKSAPVNGRNSLKNDAKVLYLRHQDGVHGYTYWEDRFKDELQANFGIKPGGQKKQQVIGKDYVTPPPPPRTETPHTSVPGSTSATGGIQRGTVKNGLQPTVPMSHSASVGDLFSRPPKASETFSSAALPRQSPRSAATSRRERPNESDLLNRPTQSGVDVPCFVPTTIRQPGLNRGTGAVAHQGESSPPATAPTFPKAPLPTPWSEVFNEVNMKALSRRIGGYVEDNRAKGGALWIRATDHNPEAGRILRSWGFSYKLGKGWWKDPEQ
ncbi:EH signature domain-containing protein [Ottowia caeni]|uniref:EH signature domain-containing protein n=1 Tax=Ottowia caeni TaxID=2870339 RepID=UPI001E503D8F|nr:hypothetical protein [Ottowia caeni]